MPRTAAALGMCVVAGLSLCTSAPASAASPAPSVTMLTTGSDGVRSAARPKFRWRWFASKAKVRFSRGVMAYSSGNKPWFWEVLLIPGARITYTVKLPERCRQIKFGVSLDDAIEPGVSNETRFTLRRSGRTPKVYKPVTLAVDGTTASTFIGKRAKRSTRFTLRSVSTGADNDKWWYTFVGIDAYCRRR